MNIKLPFVVDPKTDKPSVSLSIVIISLLFLLTAGILNLMGKVENTSIALEFFLVACSLYWSRRINISKTGDINIGEKE